MCSARNGRRWLVGILCGLGLIVLALSAVLYTHSVRSAARREWSLQFIPHRLVLPADLPSVHETSVLLCNRGTKDEHIRLSSCCGVSIEGEPKRYVRAGQCIRISLSVDLRSPGVYRGLMSVFVPGVQSPVAALPIAAQVHESTIVYANSQHVFRLAPLVRRSSDCTSEERCVTIVPHRGFMIERIVSPVDWLAIRLRKQGKVMQMCVKALPQAPEGQFNVVLPVLYKIGKRSGRDETRLIGEVVSSVRVVPNRLFFGVVSRRQGQPMVEKVRITLRSGRNEALSISTSSADFTARVSRVQPNSYVVAVRFVPKRLGEIREYVECRQDGSVICRIPVSAMVQP